MLACGLDMHMCEFLTTKTTLNTGRMLLSEDCSASALGYFLGGLDEEDLFSSPSF